MRRGRTDDDEVNGDGRGRVRSPNWRGPLMDRNEAGGSLWVVLPHNFPRYLTQNATVLDRCCTAWHTWSGPRAVRVRVGESQCDL